MGKQSQSCTATQQYLKDRHCQSRHHRRLHHNYVVTRAKLSQRVAQESAWVPLLLPLSIFAVLAPN